jgi:hypothetical protein
VACTSSGICTFTPNAGFVGGTVFNYTISDGRTTSIALVQVTVRAGPPPPNDPPTAVDDAVSAIAGEPPVPFDVLTNDTDPNDDQLYLTGIAGTPAGNVTCSSSGLCTYVPSSGFTGVDGFTYSIADGRGGTDTGSVQVTVVSSGVAPVASLVMSPRTGFAPVGVFFDASGSHDPDGTVAKVWWDFGDGDTATGVEVSHTYAEPGTYRGTVTVTDDDGLAASLEFEFVASDLDALQLPICGDQDGSEMPLVFRCAEYGPGPGRPALSGAGNGACRGDVRLRLPRSGPEQRACRRTC